MKNAILLMMSFLSQANADGKYYALYLISILVLGAFLFGGEVKQKEQRRKIFLIGLFSIALLWDPITMVLFRKIIPSESIYKQAMLITPVLLVVPFTLAETVGMIESRKKACTVVGGFLILASLCGTLLPFGNTVCANERMSLPVDVKMLLAQLPKQEDTKLCAPDDILVWVRLERADIRLPYGKDILDSSLNEQFHTFYDAEEYNLHDSMNTNEISALQTITLGEASGCNYFIFDNEKAELEMVEQTGYLYLASTERYSLYMYVGPENLKK